MSEKEEVPGWVILGESRPTKLSDLEEWSREEWSWEEGGTKTGSEIWNEKEIDQTGKTYQTWIEIWGK